MWVVETRHSRSARLVVPMLHRQSIYGATPPPPDRIGAAPARGHPAGELLDDDILVPLLHDHVVAATVPRSRSRPECLRISSPRSPGSGRRPHQHDREKRSAATRRRRQRCPLIWQSDEFRPLGGRACPHFGGQRVGCDRISLRRPPRDGESRPMAGHPGNVG